jgi:hypothetical protein
MAAGAILKAIHAHDPQSRWSGIISPIFLPIALLQTPAKYDLIAATQPLRKITGKATP